MKSSQRPHSFPLVALLAAVVIVGAACSSPSTTSSPSTSSTSLPSTATVTIPKADRFEPFLLEVAQGARVTFTNRDTDAHTVVSMPSDVVDFKLFVAAGQSVTQTFTVPGIYGYYCDAHSHYQASNGLIKADKAADAYPISMYGVILVRGDTLPVLSGNAKIVMPSADRFEPLAIVVRKGTHVRWSNLDKDQHTVLTTPGDAIEFKLVAPAKGTVAYTFDTAGIFPYYCDAFATWNPDLKRVQAREGSSEYPAAMEGVVFVLP